MHWRYFVNISAMLEVTHILNKHFFIKYRETKPSMYLLRKIFSGVMKPYFITLWWAKTGASKNFTLSNLNILLVYSCLSLKFFLLYLAQLIFWFFLLLQSATLSTFTAKTKKNHRKPFSGLRSPESQPLKDFYTASDHFHCSLFPCALIYSFVFFLLRVSSEQIEILETKLKEQFFMTANTSGTVDIQGCLLPF